MVVSFSTQVDSECHLEAVVEHGYKFSPTYQKVSRNLDGNLLKPKKPTTLLQYSYTLPETSEDLVVTCKNPAAQPSMTIECKGYGNWGVVASAYGKRGQNFTGLSIHHKENYSAYNTDLTKNLQAWSISKPVSEK